MCIRRERAEDEEGWKEVKALPSPGTILTAGLHGKGTVAVTMMTVMIEVWITV
jgi:hypothetical protein